MGLKIQRVNADLQTKIRLNCHIKYCIVVFKYWLVVFRVGTKKYTISYRLKWFFYCFEIGNDFTREKLLIFGLNFVPSWHCQFKANPSSRLTLIFLTESKGNDWYNMMNDEIANLRIIISQINNHAKIMNKVTSANIHTLTRFPATVRCSTR